MEQLDFDTIIQTIKLALDTGIVKILSGVLVLMSLLAVIDFAIAVLNNVGSTDTIFKVVVKKFLKYAFFFYVIKNFVNITDLLFKFFTSAGILFIDGSITSNNAFSLNKMAVVLFEGIMQLIKVVQGGGFSGLMLWGFFYLVMFVIAFFLAVALLITIAFKIIQFYIVSAVSVILFAFNLFEPLSDIGEKAIRSIINTGVQLTLAIALAGIGIQIMTTKSQEFNLDKINANNNDILAVMLYIILLAIITILVSQVDNISMLIVAGQGAGFSVSQLGSQVTRAVATTANAVINTVAIAAGGAGLLKAGAEMAGSEAAKQAATKTLEKGAEKVALEKTAEKSGRAVNGSMESMKSSYENHEKNITEKPKSENKQNVDTNRPSLNTIEQQKNAYQNETSVKPVTEKQEVSKNEQKTIEKPISEKQDNKADINKESKQEGINTTSEVKEKSRIQSAKESYNDIKHGTFGNTIRGASNVTNKGVSAVTGGEENQLNDTDKKKKE